jgi:hypothetical protein
MSGQSVAWPRFEPVIFREQVTILATYARFVVTRTITVFSPPSAALCTDMQSKYEDLFFSIVILMWTGKDC